MSAATVVWIVLALFVLLRGVFGLMPSMWGWGLNVQRFLDPVSGWGLWGVAALSLIPSLARWSAGSWERLGNFIARSKRADLVAALAAAALVWLMPDRVWFVGDFMIRQGNVESGLFGGNFISALPLDRFLHGSLLRLFGFGSMVAANTAARALGAVEAGLLAVLAVRFARSLGLDGAMAAAAAAAVFFGGHLTMFTGLGKPASEMCLVVVALAAFGIRAIRSGGSLLPFGMVMALALWLHRSSLFLLPTWLVVTWLWLRASAERRKLDRTTVWLEVLVPAVAVALALPRIVGLATGYDLSHHILTPEARREGGLWLEVFSPRHLLDLLNLAATWSPLALAIPALLVTRAREVVRESEAVVLATLAASFVPALLLVQPQQGVFRDWDVFAPAGLGVVLLAVFLVVRGLSAGPSRAWLATPVIVVAIVSSFQWLMLNRQEHHGLQRVRAYLVEAPGPEFADRPLVWDFLAARNMRLQRWDEAADAAAHAAEYAPHRRVLLMWALSETMREDYVAAGRVYRRLLARTPDDPLGWIGLAGTARRTGDAAELERALTKLRSYSPTGSEMRIIRRHLGYYPQVWPPPDSVAGWSPWPAGER